MGILKDFSILLKALSHYSKSVKLLNKQFLSFSPVSGIERRLSSGGGHCEPSRWAWGEGTSRDRKWRILSVIIYREPPPALAL